MRKKQFKAESKRLLDLMINSIYTHKEIFLRELISNASDAIDKLYYRSLSDSITGLTRDSFHIDIVPDKAARTLTIIDNGCGMTQEELEANLGTICKSGTLDFRANSEPNDEIDVIGQFGVGFYSAFMVAKRITVQSKVYGAQEAWQWESDGADGYTTSPCEMEAHGTCITLYLRENTDDENYDEYLDQYTLQSLIRKYSDYIRYPIRMDVTKSRRIEGAAEGQPQYEEYTENVTVNSMVPLWKRNRNELSAEDYNNFYQQNFFDYSEPLRVIHSSTEGAATYNALMFIPAKAPADYYSRDFEAGLRLYASGVLITDKCKELLPDYFNFVRGLVDSQDLSLNISREMLQHDRQLRLIASRLEKKIKSELESMLANEREKYIEFFKSFGRQLKFGIYTSYGTTKELLQDLLIFRSSRGEGMVTLREYVDAMPEGQPYIYYACGDNAERIEKLPQIERLREHGYEVLYFTEDIDEFCIKMLRAYSEKEFRSAQSGDLGLGDEDSRRENEQLAEDNKELLDFMRDSLDGKVVAVRPSDRLTSHPVCLSTEGEISLEMERVFSQMPNGGGVTAQKVLEINASHPVFETLRSLYQSDREKLRKYASLLYSQALLIEGMPVEDPVELANLICELM